MFRVAIERSLGRRWRRKQFDNINNNVTDLECKTNWREPTFMSCGSRAKRVVS